MGKGSVMRDKPAKFINKLLEQTKADALRIKELELKLARADVDASERVQSALDQTAELHRQELAKIGVHIQKINDDHAADWKTAAARQDAQLRQMGELSAKNAQLEDDLAATKCEVDNLVLIKTHQEGRIKELESQLDTIKPELDLLEAKKAELTKLCDDVRARMRRREREEEQAILNRKAVSRSAPGLNRR